MSISLPTPVVQPSVSYGSLWINTLNIVSDDPAKPVLANISVSPWDPVSNTCLRSATVNITFSDLFAAANKDQTGVLAAAIEAIYAAVQTICGEQGLFGMTPPSGSNNNG